MNKVLEIQFSGWTATPRMPFIISGSDKGGSVCLHTPTYSCLLGLIGCCLGRVVASSEIQLGFYYEFDSVNKDLENRKRLSNKRNRITPHADGDSVYLLEFHANPLLILWINRTDWKDYFLSPIGTPSLGRSQDILEIDYVREIEIASVDEGEVSGCMLPFSGELQAGGQLVQLAESFAENEEPGTGRTPQKSKVFLSIPHDNRVMIKYPNLFKTQNAKTFYLHQFNK
jgi:CRISPR-associated protein Cas5t